MNSTAQVKSGNRKPEPAPTWSIAEFTTPANAVEILNFLAERYCEPCDRDLWPVGMLGWITRPTRTDPHGQRRIHHPLNYIVSVVDRFIADHEDYDYTIFQRFETPDGVMFDGQRWIVTTTARRGK